MPAGSLRCAELPTSRGMLAARAEKRAPEAASAAGLFALFGEIVHNQVSHSGVEVCAGKRESDFHDRVIAEPASPPIILTPNCVRTCGSTRGQSIARDGP